MMTHYKNILALFCTQIKGNSRQKGNLLIYYKKQFPHTCVVLCTDGEVICKHSMQHHSHHIKGEAEAPRRYLLSAVQTHTRIQVFLTSHLVIYPSTFSILKATGLSRPTGEW